MSERTETAGFDALAAMIGLRRDEAGREVVTGTCHLCDGEELTCYRIRLDHLVAYYACLCAECIAAICDYGEVD